MLLSSLPLFFYIHPFRLFLHSSLLLVPTFLPLASSYIHPFCLFLHSSFPLVPNFIPSACSYFHPFRFFLHTSLPLVPTFIPSACSYIHPFHLGLFWSLPYVPTLNPFNLSLLSYILCFPALFPPICSLSFYTCLYSHLSLLLKFVHLSLFCHACFTTFGRILSVCSETREPVFVNIRGARKWIPRNRFRHPL